LVKVKFASGHTQHGYQDCYGGKILNITEKADRVTAVIQAEGAYSSKMNKVVIIDEVKKDLSKNKSNWESRKQK
jgi:hypothetical protein